MRHSQPRRVGSVISGTIDPKPTTYRGVEMRSRLEADFAYHLDQEGVTWRYEPAIFGRRGEGYLPDFELTSPKGPRGWVEVKPTIAEVAEAKRRMEVILKTREDALLIVACAEGCRWFARTRDKPWTTWVARWEHQ